MSLAFPSLGGRSETGKVTERVGLTAERVGEESYWSGGALVEAGGGPPKGCGGGVCCMGGGGGGATAACATTAGSGIDSG